MGTVPIGALLLLSGCVQGAGPEPTERLSGQRPRPPAEARRALDPLRGPEAFPATAGFSVLAGPRDSTLVLFGLSLPANALRFQREGRGFVADYLVSLRFTRDSQVVARVDRRERVRVATFTETTRAKESVIFQAPVLLPAGRYGVTVRVRDALSARGMEAADTLDLAEYRSAPAVAAPVVTYRARPRTAANDTPDIILNPRRLAVYGGEPPVAYVEAYGALPDTATVELRDAGESPVWSREAPLEAGAGMAAAAVQIPVDALPPGRYTLRAQAGSVNGPASPLVVTASEDWVVPRADEVLDLLCYIASPAAVERLAAAAPGERWAAWNAFWRRRSPDGATPAQEPASRFLERVREATERFAEPGQPGWRTQRGEVYIVLGPPTFFVDRRTGRRGGGGDEVGAEEWSYEGLPAGRLDLTFVDRSGLGSYRLTAESESAFRAVARDLRERP